MTIWKYQIPVADNFIIGMPQGARFLSVQLQGDGPQMWWLVEESTSMLEQRFFRIVGTGFLFDGEGLIYLGTFQTDGDSLVWHLFEEGQK